MSLQSQSCDADRITSLIERRMNIVEEATMAEHLSGCSACCKALEDASADQQLWQKAERFLRDDDELSLPSTKTDSHCGPNGGRIVDQVLESLAPTDDPEMLGRVGEYEVSGVIGFGGMGVVLKGFDRSLKRVVAIKVMAPYLASSGPARKRFAREAQAAAAMTHDNVIDIYGVSEANGLPFLVMPYARGTSLQKRIDNEGAQSVVEVLRIGIQVASGLAAAHAQGLVHRDIKPANILLDKGIDRLVITDFGLARAVDDASVTRTGVIAGTPQYMSPEQARGELVEHRSDLFSLGSLMYALCTGRPPFRAETTFGILRRITDNEPRSIREINPEVPEWLCAIIEKLHAKEPSKRFQSAEEVAELLEDCLAHVQQPTTTPLPVGVQTLATRTQSPSTSTLATRIRALLQRKPPISKLIAAAAFAFSLIFSGVLVVIEMNKGTLTIESKVGDVPIRIMQDGETVERMTVTKSPRSIRIAAGDYRVEIDGAMQGITVKNGRVSLQRQGTEVVQVTFKPRVTAMSAEAKDELRSMIELSSPQSTLLSMQKVAELDPTNFYTELYTEDAMLEMSGFFLQQLTCYSTLSQIQQDAISQINPSMELDYSIYLRTQELFTEHMLDNPPKAAANAFEILIKAAVGNSLTPGESLVTLDRQFYRLAAGVLKSPAEFLAASMVLNEEILGDDELLEGSSFTFLDPGWTWDVKIDGETATATVVFDNETDSNDEAGIPVTLELRKIEDQWLVSQVFSDEMLDGLRTAVSYMFADPNEASGSDVSQNPLIGKWRLQSKKGLEPMPEFVVFGERIARLSMDEQSGRTEVYAYTVMPDGIVELKAFRNGEFEIAGRAKFQVEDKHLYMAVHDKDSNTSPTDAKGDSTEPNTSYNVFIRQQWSQSEQDDAKKADNESYVWGKVLSRDVSSVVVSLGTDNGVNPGDTLEADKAAFLKVVTATADQCVARIDAEDSEHPLQVGHPVITERAKYPRATMTQEDPLQSYRDAIELMYIDQEVTKLVRDQNAKDIPAALELLNARSVVEAYVAAALAGDVAKAASLAKSTPADPKRIAELPELLNLQRLKIRTVYVSDPAQPTQALATSEAIKLDDDHKQPDGQSDGFLVLSLEVTDGKWLVFDIDFESESGAEKELKRFVEENPNAIGLPPPVTGQGEGNVSNPSTSMNEDTADDVSAAILVSDDDSQGHKFKAGDRVNVYLLSRGQGRPDVDEEPVLENVVVQSVGAFATKENDPVKWSGQSVVVAAPADSVLLEPENELFQDL